MDYKDMVTNDDFKNLSREEKEKIVRGIIKDFAEGKTDDFLIFNGEGIDNDILLKMIETIGEDKIVNDIIERIDDVEFNKIPITLERCNEALKRKKNGTATKEDELIIDAMYSSYHADKGYELYKNTLSVMIELISFAQNNVGYNPTLGEMLATFDTLATYTGMYSEKDSILKNYKNDTLLQAGMVIEKISDNIVNTLKDSCEELPDDTTVFCALLRAAVRIGRDIDLLDTKIYKEILEGVIYDNVEVKKSNMDFDDKHTKKSNKDMKNILKDN